MAMLSELLKFNVVDADGRRARLRDLEVALLDDEYPRVTGIHFSSNGSTLRLDWEAVTGVNSSAREIRVSDVKAGRKVSEKKGVAGVLLKGDVLDALIIDLLSRRTTRATDLRLDVSDDSMELKAVDTGLGAMLRRITRGAFRGGKNRDMFDWKYVEFLRGDPQAVDSGAGYHMRIGRLPAGEIAQIADYIPYLHAAELLTLIADEKAALVLQAMSIERQVQVIEEFDEEQAVALLTMMSPDRATDLIGRLHVPTMKKYLALIPMKQRERIIDLLRYPEDSVGGVMINNTLCIGDGTTVKSARQQVRSHSKERDFIGVIFVTESANNKTLRGTLTLRALMDAEDDEKLSEVMDPYVVTLNPQDNSVDAAYRVMTGQIGAMAVTDPDGKLIGAMTIESAISQVVSPGSALNAVKVFS